MRPDKQLAGLLGLTEASSTLSNAYLLVNTISGPGVGIVDDTIQYHGTADLYTLSGATALALLYSTANTPTVNPAISTHSVGSGIAVAFTYDLARSVVYTRQGNPAWVGQDRDGISPIRSDDLFYGNALLDPQPDWVDLNKVAIPQADEQQRLLGNIILQSTLEDLPLPRFWYFPRDECAVVVMTSDDHGSGDIVGRLDRLKALSPIGGLIENWETIRSSSYLYLSSQLTDAQAAAYTVDGFEIGCHVETGCADFTPISLESAVTSQLTAFYSKFTSIPPQVSHRLHCVVWSDWTSLPKVEFNHGIRLDTNYYYWPSSWVDNRPGFFTGSGMPMRFADLNGTRINVYQAVTQMTDESDQVYPFTINTLLDRAVGPEGYYGVFTANMHHDAGAIHSSEEAIIASAQAHGVPSGLRSSDA